MLYARYLDIPNWEDMRDQLLKFRNEYSNTKELWWCHFRDEVKTYLPELYKNFSAMGLTVNQLIFFVNLPNDIEISDPTDDRAIFIHTDSQDSDNQIGVKHPLDQMFATPFKTSNAINIPLLNCDGTYTLWYKKINDNKEVLYTHYGCGGHMKSDVEEIYRFELNKPTAIRIDVPHGVWNPNKQPRVVATFRFNESLETILDYN